MLRSVSLHVLVHNVEDWIPQEWREHLGEAVSVLGGLHWCLGQYPRFKSNTDRSLSAWENYFNKVATMAYIAQRLQQKYIVSLDDDIFIAPSSLAFLVESGPKADEEGCGVVAPLLQNGVPTAELFAETFLTDFDKALLYECFETSGVHWWHEPWHS